MGLAASVKEVDEFSTFYHLLPDFRFACIITFNFTST